MKWLDENYNANDYSIVQADYKYPSELTQGELKPFQSRHKASLLTYECFYSVHELQLNHGIPHEARGLAKIPLWKFPRLW